jgi:hypothetical protein
MVLRGTIHGDTIKLERVSGLPDGQVVTIDLQPASTLTPEERLAALKRAFGAWSDDPEGVDRFVEETYRLRGSPRDVRSGE